MLGKFFARRTLFMVSLQYKVPLSMVEQHLPAHRFFLEQQYQAGTFIASGPKEPRTGGVIIASSATRQILDSVLAKDPFHAKGVAEYQVTEFHPTMARKDFEKVLEADQVVVGKVSP